MVRAHLAAAAARRDHRPRAHRHSRHRGLRGVVRGHRLAHVDQPAEGATERTASHDRHQPSAQAACSGHGSHPRAQRGVLAANHPGSPRPPDKAPRPRHRHRRQLHRRHGHHRPRHGPRGFRDPRECPQEGRRTQSSPPTDPALDRFPRCGARHGRRHQPRPPLHRGGGSEPRARSRACCRRRGVLRRAGPRPHRAVSAQ